jgi:hypothetical protein
MATSTDDAEQPTRLHPHIPEDVERGHYVMSLHSRCPDHNGLYELDRVPEYEREHVAVKRLRVRGKYIHYVTETPVLWTLPSYEVATAGVGLWRMEDRLRLIGWTVLVLTNPLVRNGVLTVGAGAPFAEQHIQTP